MLFRQAVMLGLVSVIQVCLAGTSYAQGSNATAPDIAAPNASSGTKPVCIDAEVDGQRALSYGCLSAQLAPKAAPAATGVAASQSAAEALANGPSNRVGTFNLSAERNRFGSNWGKSVTPQRPPPSVAVPP
ncbi:MULTISPECIES: hypothetical protein [Paraburkholderia]|uniref:hypothetical protein n=1 Tax=Paraburkholderia TaxID=1822464 RepID=UPI00224F841C|nr:MULTISPECIES: hypothetical protein [Paraburkholderia]MCX4161687.1 hypothetical protein [Paraburkholderia megapolitana]MDN7157184.1 hypothetical protein [Paraburkholderia sp. CHISQ3]MDQ6494229.1 hypothetical protein [Paraburkholderia megapolitana]